MLTYDELREVAEAIESKRHASRKPVDRLRLRLDNRAQARPGSDVWALVASNAGSNDAARKAEGGLALEAASFSWGFDMPWNKSLAFNTRIESALDGSRLWADAIKDGRCILPVASFFEPHESETVRSPRTGRPMKRQYEFASPDGAPLLLASIQQAGRISVVTTEPNAVVKRVHARMPLVLRFEEAQTWMQGDYAMLADRSGLDLEAWPEHIDDDSQQQLNLF